MLIRRDLFKSALAAVAGLFGLGAAKVLPRVKQGRVIDVYPDECFPEPELELRKIMRDGKQVRMSELRNGDVFTMDDIEGRWKATSAPYIVELGGGLSPWGIEAQEFNPDESSPVIQSSGGPESFESVHDRLQQAALQT